MAKVKEKSGPLLNYCWSKLVLLVLLLNEIHGQTYCEEKPKILFYRKGQAALVSGGGGSLGVGSGASGSDTPVDNHVVISNVNKEFLACVSSRNVEWTYEGYGEPSKFQESSNVDIQKYDDGSISYCLTSQITFSNKQSDTELSRHTGRYSCREIGNVSNTASVYVFASRRNSPSFLQSRKTITLPLSPENITVVQIPPMKTHLGRRKSRSGDADANGTEGTILIPTPVLTIPCVTTHPNISVKLLKKGKNNIFGVYKGASYLFDPKHGFRLNASVAKLDDFYGDYKCVSSANVRLKAGTSANGGRSMEEDLINRNTEDFVLITLEKPKTFQAFPPVNEVYTSGMLNLTCESEEPVVMKEVLPHTAQDLYAYLDEDDYARDRSDDIVETTEKTEQKTHVANYMEISPEPGRTGEIQCLTEKEGKVLHTWRYRIIRKRADKWSGIKFNKRENSFTCKSKLGAPGRLSFVSCRTPSECRINKICLTKSENCRGYSNATRAFCERKTHFCGKIFYKGGSGLIRCIGEGIDEIRGFTDEAATDEAVRMGFAKLKASETALFQLTAIEKQNNDVGGANVPSMTSTEKEQKVKGTELISEGDRVNVTLRMGYYFFLYPVQWAAKFKNGSTAQLTPDFQTLKVERLTRTVYATLRLPYTSATTFLKDNSTNNRTADEAQPLSEITALHALIPLRSSVEPSWKTISLPLTVYGKTGAPPLPSDSDGEDLLAEQAANDKAPEDKSSSSQSQTAFSSDDDEDTEGDDDEDDGPQVQEATNSSSNISTGESNTTLNQEQLTNSTSFSIAEVTVEEATTTTEFLPIISEDDTSAGESISKSTLVSNFSSTMQPLSSSSVRSAEEQTSSSFSSTANVENGSEKSNDDNDDAKFFARSDLFDEVLTEVNGSTTTEKIQVTSRVDSITNDEPELDATTTKDLVYNNDQDQPNNNPSTDEGSTSDLVTQTDNISSFREDIETTTPTEP